MQPGLWSDILDVTTAAGVPDVATPPEVVCKSPHVVLVSWIEPACNGSPVIDYHLEWQMKDDQDFMPVGINLTISNFLRTGRFCCEEQFCRYSFSFSVK